jgi:serine/threonine protein kinase
LKVINKEFDLMDISYFTVNYGQEKNCYTKFTAAIVWANCPRAQNFLGEIERQNGLRLEIFAKPILYFCFGGFLYVLYPYLKKKSFKKRGIGAEVYREVEDFISLFKTLGDRRIAFRTFCLENIFLVHNKIKLVRSQNLVYDSELDVTVLKKPNCYRMFDPLVFNPPELFDIGWCDSKCDIWTLGVYIFLVVTGKLPFGPKTYDFNLQMRESLMEPIPRDINKDLKYLIRDMLRLDPNKRITIAQVLASPWVQHQAAKSDHRNAQIQEVANAKIQETKSSWNWFKNLDGLKNLAGAT